ncbi:YbfB/YjiJ family MFS transporter [Rhodobacteraceae bacterium RKSG542]|uniref:YbfB/YjiJ family MFS transporter n=1 Tax=Pseudovibrio flavus TaxID=2529854 RepID=UPI0012BB6953|nr:YbfB/YjiJ family MFS transporter [Pseudovibrio flavus]MTI18930.1 YbfB/YjiJ family MFS transporter [Pseudovibrio flavus]
MISKISSFRLAFGGCLSLVVAMGIGRFVYTPILPFMLADGQLSPVSSGVVASANYLGYLLGAMAAALLPTPFGLYRCFAIAIAMASLTTLAMGAPFLEQLPTLLGYGTIRFVSGVASAYGLVLSATLVLDELTARGDLKIFPVHFAGVGTGIALSSLLVEITGSTIGMSASTLWLLCGAVSLLLTFAVLTLIPAPKRAPVSEARQEPQSSQNGKTKLSANAYRLILAYGFFGLGYVITATFLSVIADQQHGLSNYKSFIWMMVGIAGVPSVFLWGRIGAKIGNKNALLIAFILEAIGVALSVLWPSLTGLIISAVLFGGTFIAITTLGLLEAKILVPQSPRLIVGLMTASFSLGQVIGPLISSALYEQTGDFTIATLFASLMLVLCALMVIKPFTPPVPQEV